MTFGSFRAPSTDEVLAERARALAVPPQASELVETIGSLLVTIGRERYALLLSNVVAIAQGVEVTPIPGTPEHWIGIANIHGTLYPVLDVGRFIAGAPSPPKAHASVVLVRGGGLEVGLLVDQVSEVTALRRDEIGASPAGARGRVGVQGITRDLIALLDVDGLLSDPRLAVDDEAS